jgi:predicted permease
MDDDVRPAAIAAWCGRIAAGIAQRVGAFDGDAARDIARSVSDVCAMARARGGWLGAASAGALECADIVIAAARRRWSGGPRVTGGYRAGGARSSRQGRGTRRTEMFRDDLRYAVRRLRSGGLTSAAAMAMLALGIGITTAMFTVVDALILRPVPFRDPDRLAQMYMGTDRGGRTVVLPSVLNAWRRLPVIEAAESAVPATSLLETEDGRLASRASATISPGLLRMLGVRALRGRVFEDGDGRAGSDDRVLISEHVWRVLFESQADVIGRRVRVDGTPMVVVGVLPDEFRFPAWDTAVWKPLDYDALPAAQAKALPRPYVRFAPGVPQADALRTATEAAHATDPETAKLRAIAYPMAGLQIDPYYQRAMPVLAGGVVLVFIALCANVTSLLLARLGARRREFGMCSALGASRLRLIRQAFVESAALAAAGSIAGVALAWLLVSVIRSYLPEAFLLRSLNPVNVDLRALGVAMGFGVVATMVAGLLPAWIGTRAEAASVGTGERTGTETRAARTTTRTLLVVEVALACTLLAGATLLVRSFLNLTRVDRGLDVEGVVTGWVSIPSATFADPQSRTVMASSLAEQVRSLPGVSAVVWSYGRPPGGGAISFGEWTPDTPGAAPIDLVVESYYVENDFFDFYDIPLVKGRRFEPQDTSYDVIVGERLAAALWPDLEPVGRSFRFGKYSHRVIGVAREIHLPSVDPREDNPEFYRPFGGRYEYASINIRCAGACPDLAQLRKRLAGVHPAVVVGELGAAERGYDEELARPRAAAALAFIFAIIAVLAAAGGLFSVLAYAVGRRRREFGIRTALGARPDAIRNLVLRDGLAIAAVGVALGSVGAWALGRFLSSMQYGVSPADPFSWAIVLALLMATTIAAAWRPARQAMRVDPASLLRD